MSTQTLISRVRGVLLQPRETWPQIADEPSSVSGIYRNYVLILAALPPLGMLIGTALFGIHIPLVGTIRVGFGTLLTQAVLSYAVALLMTYVMALVIEWLAPKFGASGDRLQGLKTAAYAFTPVWVVGILDILPGVGALVALLGLGAAVYAVYLIRLGLPHTMKCPEEKSVRYTAAVVVIGVVLGFVLNIVVAGMSGMGRYTHELSGTDQDAHVDKDSPMGKLESWSKRMEEAGKQMEAAQKSGDSAARQQAAQNMLGAVLGGDASVKALDPDTLGGFLPQTLVGMPRSDFSAERNQAMGMQFAQAEARYADEHRRLHVEIMDMGGSRGVFALAGFANIANESTTDTGFEKTYSDDGRMVHEKWDKVDGRGEYSIVIGQRFVVKVEGHADSVDTLRAAANALDTGKLEKLKSGSRE